MSQLGIPIGALAGIGAAGVVAPVDAPPSVPAYDLASTSYYFGGAANHFESADQRAILLPAGGGALPAVTQDWFQAFRFSVDDWFQFNQVGYGVGGKGTQSIGFASSSPSTNCTSISVRGRVDSPVSNARTLTITARNAAIRAWEGASLMRSSPLEAGESYLLVYGQKGAFPFTAVVRLTADGDHDPAVVDRLVGANNEGGAGVSGWKYTNGNVAQYAAGYEFITSLGAQAEVADGGNRTRSVISSAGNFVNVWGSFPFTGGLPDADVLLQMANGTLDPAQLATLVGGTLQYANQLRGPGDLGADPRGTVKAAATEVGTLANTFPAPGAPLRRPPELRLRSYGPGFVFPMSRRRVPFVGTFLGTAAADSFEARLLRVDNGLELVGWTTLNATVNNSAKTFVADLMNVPLGAAFRREIRWRNRPAITYRDGDFQGLGMVIADVGQSQEEYMANASNTPDGGSGANLVPSRTTNCWMSTIKQPYATNAQAQTIPDWYAGLYIPHKVGMHGDGNIATYEQIKRTLGVPVMFVITSTSGTHPNRWYSDRQVFAYSSFGTFAPDGTATTFNFTPVSTAVRMDLDASAPCSAVPGSVQINVGSVSITDDGNGNLIGAGITAGTINYNTGAISGLTFATAPASGVSVSGSFRFWAVSLESQIQPHQGAMSMWGDTTQPLNRTYNKGRMMLHLKRLRGVPPSLFRVHWFTAFETGTLTSAIVSTIFDKLKAKFDALYPVAADALWGVILPGRVATGAELPTIRAVNTLHRIALENKPGFKILGDALDFEVANNNSAHVEPALSASFGERLGAAMASAHVTDWNANGPVMTAAKYTDANRTAIDVTFSLVSGTALTTADGSTTGITGFAVGPAGTSENAWDRTGFTATITGPNTVRLTKTSGSWTAAQRVAFANGTPVATGTSATKAADNASLLKMLSDNDNSYNGAPKFTVRAGNVARQILGVVVAEAA